jgi:argininosuccinate synthase
MPKPELDAPARLEIAFEAGLPVSINGISMSLPELIESVSTIAGTHGVGRVTETSGAAVHAPAAVVLQAAHDALGAEAARASGATVCLELFRGQHRILSAHHS